MKKIIIIPTFASSHFLKCWLPNINETLHPDQIFIVEGLMPNGPENKGNLGDSFYRNFTYHKTGYFKPQCGFDWEETVQICSKFKNVMLLDYMYPPDYDSTSCFKTAISLNGRLIEYVTTNDIVIVIEPDAFLLEADVYIIEHELSMLKPGDGLRCVWRDFLETQYYCENINEHQPKWRRFAYCWDNLENFIERMGSGFTSQNYPALKKTESFFIRHYCWFQPEPYKQLRYELIYRSNPQYWKDFDGGLTEIRRRSTEYKKWEIGQLDEMPNVQRVTIRPSRTDEGRYAKFINIDHPKHIQSHPNFVK